MCRRKFCVSPRDPAHPFCPLGTEVCPLFPHRGPSGGSYGGFGYPPSRPPAAVFMADLGIQ
eukprot:3281285-Lingulodinium_polyedra.AAC.1